MNIVNQLAVIFRIVKTIFIANLFKDERMDGFGCWAMYIYQFISKVISIYQ